MDIATLLLGHSELCEDAVRIERVDGETALIAVADGAGVGRGGGEAAHAACDAAIEEMAALGVRKRRQKSKVWERLLRRVDERVREAWAPGECTLVAIALDGASISGVSVGDSAAWLIGPHSKHGLTMGQAKAPLAGSGEAEGAPFHATLEGPSSEDERGKHGGGALVVMTDGVWRYVGDKFIADAALHSSPKTAVARIEEMARAALNGRLVDDVGLVIVRR